MTIMAEKSFTVVSKFSTAKDGKEEVILKKIPFFLKKRILTIDGYEYISGRYVQSDKKFKDLNKEEISKLFKLVYENSIGLGLPIYYSSIIVYEEIDKHYYLLNWKNNDNIDIFCKIMKDRLNEFFI